MSEEKELKPESGSPEELKKDGENGSPVKNEESIQLTKEEYEKLLKSIEDTKVSLVNAEDSIVKYKKLASKAKQGENGVDEEVLQSLIDAKVSEKLDEKLSEIDVNRKTKEQEALTKAHKTINELSESLKAKHSITNSSIGSNKDNPKPDEDLTRHFDPANLVILTRSATNQNMTIQEYLKKNRSRLGI